MSDHILLPVLEDLKQRLERIEAKLNKLTGDTPKTVKETKTEQSTLAMDEIQDYLQKINMA